MEYVFNVDTNGYHFVVLKVTMCVILTAKLLKLQVLSACVVKRLSGELCDLNVTGSRPPLATRHIRYVLLLNNRLNKLNLLSWLLIYLYNK